MPVKTGCRFNGILVVTDWFVLIWDRLYCVFSSGIFWVWQVLWRGHILEVLILTEVRLFSTQPMTVQDPDKFTLRFKFFSQCSKNRMSGHPLHQPFSNIHSHPWLGVFALICLLPSIKRRKIWPFISCYFWHLTRSSTHCGNVQIRSWTARPGF